jgi:hypothetical protein
MGAYIKDVLAPWPTGGTIRNTQPSGVMERAAVAEA